jgi:hypothetical protein
MLELDLDEDPPWKYGLLTLAVRGVTVLVHVEGLDSPDRRRTQPRQRRS